ncbi:MAG: acetoin utilization deacetylase AcuC-like enzyme [Cycloclasticus sp.]|jgi:acetoin utilization deacetylase AcuC-like enzyme
MKTAYITHPDCFKHEMTLGHPENPQRLYAIQDQLKSKLLWDLLEHIDAPNANEEALLRVHSQQHIDYIFNNAPQAGQQFFQVDPDTSMNEFTLSAAKRAAGAGIKAVNLIMEKQIDNAFCAVRPPGHHAERNSPMGFCFFNNIGVAVAHALETYGLERVAIIDFDVHQGNGTEDIFKNDARVLVCSTYEHPLYPFSNHTSISGHLVNSPLHRGASGLEFREAVRRDWLPELSAFKPQFVFISAGFDAHWEDDIAQLRFSDDDFAWVTREIVEIARKHADNRIVSMLEGGYALNALARSTELHIRVLMELD